jgi:hypothetical protein
MSIEHISNDLCILSADLYILFAAILMRSIMSLIQYGFFSSFMQYGFFSFLAIMSAPILISNSVLVDSTVLNVCMAILLLLMVTWFAYLVYHDKNQKYYLTKKLDKFEEPSGSKSLSSNTNPVLLVLDTLLLVSGDIFVMLQYYCTFALLVIVILVSYICAITISYRDFCQSMGG